MQRFSRVFLIVFGTLLTLATLALLGVNLYVQSLGTQTRIQQELSQRLGTPLHIQRISVTPWSGLKLSGITIPQVSGSASESFLAARTFRLRIRFSSLFSRRLVIKEVSLVDPHVVWAQNADGKWRLPGSTQTENLPVESGEEGAQGGSSSGGTQTEPSGVSIPSVSIAPNVAGRAQEMANESVRPRFVPEIQRIRVKGGNFRFLEESGKFVAAFEGLELRSNVREFAGLEGNAKVARISLRDRFFLKEMRSALRYEPGKLELSQISAQIGGGDLTGRFAMQPQAGDSPFNLAVTFRDVEAEQVIVDAGGEKGMVKGKLEGNFEATGKIADANALSGTGTILLRDGQLRQYSLLVALGQVLQIEELTQLKLEQAQVKYHIDAGLVTVEEMILRSPNIHLSAKGTIALDGKMRLDSQLAINEKIRNQLFKPIRGNFRPVDEPGYFAVDFEVGGTIDRPKSNLVEKVVGKDLKDFGNVINSFLGGVKTERQKKKEPVNRPADSTQSVSPGVETERPAPSASP